MSGGQVSPAPGDIERWVVATCRELGVELDGPDGDFFEAGGTSLAATRLIARAEARYGQDALPPDDLFAESGVRAIAAAIGRNSRRAAAPDPADADGTGPAGADPTGARQAGAGEPRAGRV